jgi:hypothetical protein
MAELDIRVRAETEQAAKQIEGFSKKAETSFGKFADVNKSLAQILQAVEKNTISTANAIKEFGTTVAAVKKEKLPPPPEKEFERFNGTIGVLVGRLPKLRDALLRATDPKQIERLNKIIAETQNRVRTLSTAGTTAATGVQTLTAATGRANTTLVNFGRVVQDAPFGIIGIANNIDPLVDSFQRLKRESGSTGTALKALVGGLAGPAGIAIAVSAITSSLIAFGPRIKDFINNFGKANVLSLELRESLKSLSEGVATDLIQSGKLIAFAGDLSRSTDERRKAIVALNQEYPELLSNQQQEQILLGKTNDAYDKVIETILRRATIKGLELEIEKQVGTAAEKLLNIERQKIDAANKFAQQQNEAARAATFTRDAFSAQNKELIESGRAAAEIPSELRRAQSLAENFVSNTPINQIARIREELKQSLGPLLDLVNNFSDLGVKSKDVKQASEKTKDAVQKTAAIVEKLKGLDFFAGAPAGSIANLNKEIQFLRSQQELTFDPGVFQNYQREIDSLTAKISAITGAGAGLPSLNELDKGTGTTLLASIIGKPEEIKDASLAAQQLQQGFTGIFDAISSGDSPIKSLINIVKRLVIQLAAAAAAAALLSAFLPGGFAIGGTKVKGFSSILGGLLGLAQGGIVSNPTPAIIGDGGPEAVIPLSQLSRLIGGGGNQQSGPLIAIARGNDLYFSNRRASQSYGRLFG